MYQNVFIPYFNVHKRKKKKVLKYKKKWEKKKY